ncbi:MAG: hypothetical protein D3903_17005 [Candidatus Electrothrix sp. GM3_4]|nr:hypothetical protein [Candidatus Electrothrix sp. GM3_4]
MVREKTISLNLRARENVLWSGSDGYLGAFLTNNRFSVISTSSTTWKTFSLKTDEAEKGVVSLSPYMALLVTENSAIAFNTKANQFVEVQFPIYDKLLATKVGKYVAVVITSSRVFGLAAESSNFTNIDLRTRETLKDIKITSSKAIIHTSDRLLTFKASHSTWSEHRLDWQKL